MPELPAAAMKRLIIKAREQSGKIRVSEGAALELATILEEQALIIAGKAIELSNHRGAKTVSRNDILVAARR